MQNLSESVRFELKTERLILRELDAEDAGFMLALLNDALANAEDMHGPTVAWIRGQAALLGAVVTGSVQLRTDAGVFNRMLWATPEGGLHHYDKRHLFRMADEHLRYHSGRERLIVELKGWRICPQVCYDLRFPIWSRNRHDRETGKFDYDLLLFVANWPAARRYAWSTLLRARAIENLSYCVGVNRVGVDGNTIAYAGDSAVLDFLGQPLAELGAQEQILTVTLDPGLLKAHRERFPAWMDADDFTLSV